jgi:hypothetical protein
MSNIIRPGAGILFMKVGTHARETLSDIIARKTKEIKDTGFAMWGYGGGTCHPLSMVQPFAKRVMDGGQPIYLCMEQMNSKHFAEQLCAAEYSADNENWQSIPETINVLGSRYALLIEDLHKEEFTLPLDQTRVAVGPNTGRLGSRYIKGRVDKACLEVLDKPEKVNAEQGETKERSINLVARLRAPYAVFLRKYRA